MKFSDLVLTPDGKCLSTFRDTKSSRGACSLLLHSFLQLSDLRLHLFVFLAIEPLHRKTDHHRGVYKVQEGDSAHCFKSFLCLSVPVPSFSAALHRTLNCSSCLIKTLGGIYILLCGFVTVSKNICLISFPSNFFWVDQNFRELRRTVYVQRPHHLVDVF